MKTEQYYDTMKREAARRLSDGDLPGSIEIQTRLVDHLMAGGAAAVRSQPALKDQLENAASELVDVLRWDGRYEAAIALQDQLVAFLPASAQALRLGAANLRVEGGQAEAGLAQLEELAAADPDNFWFKVSTGLAYLYLERFEQAEAILRQAAALAHIRKVDRALAQRYLFGLLDHQGRTGDALASWREAARLDRSLRSSMLPAVCRMLVYWHAFREAGDHIALETNPVRRSFYRGLLLHALKQPKEAVEQWRSVVVDNNPAALKEGQDEYAEACVRLHTPANAIAVLDPLIKAGQTGCFRAVILGLAWAQQRDLTRAVWFMDAALRLGDMERPRRTMPAPQGRILDIHARLLYAESAIDQELRLSLNQYFFPVKVED